MRTSVRSGTLVLMPATTPWAPTTALVPEDSPSQLTAGPVRVHNSQTYTSGKQCCQPDYYTNRPLFKWFNAFCSRRHWRMFAGWERVPWRTGLREHDWLLPMCHALWAWLQENSWWSQLHRYLNQLYWSRFAFMKLLTVLSRSKPFVLTFESISSSFFI